MQTVADETKPGWSPWVVAVIVGLGIVIAFNVFYVYMALTHLDPIDPAYVTQPR